jgi:hypothetical protein
MDYCSLDGGIQAGIMAGIHGLRVGLMPLWTDSGFVLFTTAPWKTLQTTIGRTLREHTQHILVVLLTYTALDRMDGMEALQHRAFIRRAFNRESIHGRSQHLLEEEVRHLDL